jgi:hypothetical protein
VCHPDGTEPPRFSLEWSRIVAVDRAPQTRTVTPSGGWLAEVIRANDVL